MLRAEAAVFTPKELLSEGGEPSSEDSCSTVAPSPALTAQGQDCSPMLSPYWGYEDEEAMWTAAALYAAGYATDECGNFLPEFSLPVSEFTDEPAYIRREFDFKGAEVCQCGEAFTPDAFFCRTCGTKRPFEDADSQESTSAGAASPKPGLAPPPGLLSPPGLDLEEIGLPPGLCCAEPKVSPLPPGSTTAMLRNIPNKYTQAGLVDRLHKLGYIGQLDFMYLPIDFKNKCNVGYAFVNFRTAEACERFAAAFHQSNSRDMLPGYNSKKVCEVAPARYQGCEENVRRLQASSVMTELLANPEWLPKLFDENGQEVGFPCADSSTKEASQPSRSARGRLPRRKGSM